MSQTHEIKDYYTAATLGQFTGTEAQYRQYVAMSDRDTGTMRLGALPIEWYDLDETHQGIGEDTTIYID